MATLKQKELAKNIVENFKRPKKLNKKELLVLAGYSEITATANPGVIIDQKGVKEELRIMGFSAENAKRVIARVMDDETAEDKDVLKAAELTLKVTGDFAAEKSVNVNLNADDLSNLIKDGLAKFRT